jgi:integrase
MAKPPDSPPTTPTKPGEVLVDLVLEEYMRWVEVNRSPASFDLHKRLLHQFGKSIPRTLAVDNVKPFHVTRVMDAKAADWSPTTRRTFASAVQRAFNWALDQGLIDRNPIQKLAKPAAEPREMAITPAEHARILDAVASPGFRDLLELAWETGLRPQEIRAIESRHVDLEAGTIRFPRSESKGKRSIRVVYVSTARGREIIARLCRERPEGPILLNGKGKPWTRFAISDVFRRVAQKTGTKVHLGAYRKGFVTEALKNGVDTVTVAHLVGHANATMISRVYAKVHQDPEYMAEAARRAKGEVSRNGNTET